MNRTFLEAPARISVSLLLAAQAVAQGPSWSRVSIGLAGFDPDDESYESSISDDGRFVAFASAASNLVPLDTNQRSDVFVHDRATGLTTRESVATSGAQGFGASMGPELSGDGRLVAFVTRSDFFGLGAPLHTVCAKDLQSGVLELVSVAQGGGAPNGESAIDMFGLPQRIGVSHDGRYVAFASLASNLVAGDTNAAFDVFVRDRLSGSTSCVSLATSGAQANGSSRNAAISSDGRFVAFESSATNLVTPDANGATDVFLHDRVTGRTVRCSNTPSGAAGNSISTLPDISGDGRRVVFSSAATNLHATPTSGFQVHVYDAVDGLVTLVSRNPAGQAVGGGMPRISANGSYVAFRSAGVGLAPNVPAGTLGVFVAELPTGAFRWATAGPTANPFDAFYPAISADGRFVALTTDATGIDGLDFNQLTDVYLFDGTSGDWPDSDGDLHGAAGAFVFGDLATPGRAGNPLDCDDANPTRFAGAREILDGLDNDCDGLVDDGVIEVYCSTSTTSGGCVPRIGSAGAPRVGAGSGFVIDIVRVDGQRQGVLFYGVDNTGFTPLPWSATSSSTLCVRPPVQRSAIQTSGGVAGQCNGLLLLDWSQFVASQPFGLGQPFLAGDDVHVQAWFRDPPAPRGTNLSDALRFTLRP